MDRWERGLARLGECVVERIELADRGRIGIWSGRRPGGIHEREMAGKLRREEGAELLVRCHRIAGAIERAPPDHGRSEHPAPSDEEIERSLERIVARRGRLAGDDVHDAHGGSDEFFEDELRAGGIARGVLGE